MADQDLPAGRGALADLASAAKARTAAAADAARARRRSSVSSQQAKGEDLQGGGGEEPDTPRAQGGPGRIPGLCAGVLGDENASAGEGSAATACLSLVGGPAKARRHPLSRRPRTLATRPRLSRGEPKDVVPSAGPLLLPRRVLRVRR